MSKKLLSNISIAKRTNNPGFNKPLRNKIVRFVDWIAKIFSILPFYEYIPKRFSSDLLEKELKKLHDDILGGLNKHKKLTSSFELYLPELNADKKVELGFEDEPFDSLMKRSDIKPFFMRIKDYFLEGSIPVYETLSEVVFISDTHIGLGNEDKRFQSLITVLKSVKEKGGLVILGGDNFECYEDTNMLYHFLQNLSSLGKEYLRILSEINVVALYGNHERGRFGGGYTDVEKLYTTLGIEIHENIIIYQKSKKIFATHGQNLIPTFEMRAFDVFDEVHSEMILKFTAFMHRIHSHKTDKLTQNFSEDQARKGVNLIKSSGLTMDIIISGHSHHPVEISQDGITSIVGGSLNPNGTGEYIHISEEGISSIKRFR